MTTARSRTRDAETMVGEEDRSAARRSRRGSSVWAQRVVRLVRSALRSGPAGVRMRSWRVVRVSSGRRSATGRVVSGSLLRGEAGRERGRGREGGCAFYVVQCPVPWYVHLVERQRFTFWGGGRIVGSLLVVLGGWMLFGFCIGSRLRGAT